MASMKKFKYAGVIPYALTDQGYMFLLGREKYVSGWSGSNKWSEFGGKLDPRDENVYATAAREAYEESMGFLGTREELYARLYDAPGHAVNSGFSIPLEIEYNPELAQLFKRVFEYFSFIRSPPEGRMEKTEIRWFSVQEIKTMTEPRDLYPIREWYKVILLEIIAFLEIDKRFLEM